MRDDFSKATIDNLGKRVGFRCCNPACRKLTTGPRSDGHQSVNIGVAAHITAAAPGGPRFDPNLAEEQRGSAGNGIWLCQSCGKLVDNDPARFSIDKLLDWKRRAEEAARAEVEGHRRPPLDAAAEIEVSFKKTKIESERHDYELQVRLVNRGTESLGRYHVDVEMPARVINRPDNHHLYVRDRSSRDTAFFRGTSEQYGGDIFPGDSKLVMPISYFVDDSIYRDQCGLFDLPIKVVLYRSGLSPISVEIPFADLQIF